MQRIAFYGKGGIGKSTIATGVSLHLAKSGKRVLHVGCDPKSDSSLVLLENPDSFRTVITQLGRMDESELEAKDLIMRGIHGIACIESGGPEAGIGCGGRAVSKAFEIYGDVGLLDDDADDYDVAVFDVLGDVVCGGFAAPMRRAQGSLVAIVVSEEMMAAYAANNIARACRRFADNGIALAGLVVNLRSNHADLAPLERFAAAIGTRILTVIPRDPAVGRAELSRRSIVDAAPSSPVARTIVRLAEQLMTMDRSTLTVPEPLEGDGVRGVMLGDGAELGPDLELPAGFPMHYGLGE